MSLLVELEGILYRVSLAPVERPEHAVPASALRAVVFETTDGRWVGRAVVPATVELEAITQTELRELLRQAVREG